MKKTFTIVLTLLVIICSNNVYAQSKADSASKGNGQYSTFEIGPRTGISMTRLVGKGVDVSDANTKFLVRTPVGISAQLLFSKCMGIDADLIYNTKGLEYFYDADNTFKANLILHYIDLPILFHMQFGHTNTKFIINVGPSVAYAISGRIDDYIDEQPFPGTEKINWSNTSYSRYDVAANAEIGIQQRVGPGDFSFLVAGNYGLINQNTDKYDKSITPYNVGISYNIEYLLDIGKLLH